MRFIKTAFVYSFVAGLGCEGPAIPEEGLAKTPTGEGPEVVFNLAGTPLPDIPFPNDIATRNDPTSPTGKRLNASVFASINVEQELRRQLDTLSGFGTYSSITLRFSEPLDLQNIVARHHQDPVDFSDDALFLINLNPESAQFGKPVALDVGQGNFPVTLEDPSVYFPNDPRSGSNNLLFETVEEDLNQNGVLDPGEDTDFDGVLDHPNTLTPGGDPDSDLCTFYERQTDTLIFRPLIPLEEESTYAVVLTKRLVGEDQNPIRSPFPFINHTDQTDALRPLVENGILTSLGLGFDASDGGDVAFVWSFTTQSVTRDLVTIRDGLYGEGVFSRLAEEFPTDQIVFDALVDSGTQNPFLVPAERLVPLLPDFAQILNVPSEGLASLQESFSFVDYVAMGSFISPSFMADINSSDVGYLDDSGARKPLDANDIVRRSFDINYQTGEGRIGKDRVSFLISVPKRTENSQEPFPVVLFIHGYGSNRLQALGFAGNLARHGFATVGIEVVGHGLGVDNTTDLLAFGLLTEHGLGKTWKVVTNGRQLDLNGDGVGDSGGDFFSGYPFHTRDNIRQTAIDAMQMVRILRTFDGNNRWSFDLNGDGQDELAGDLNGDGIVDLGGPDNRYFGFGESAGGIIVEILGAAEPKLTAIAEAASTGGLSESGMRSLAVGLRESTILRAMGPLLLGLPNAEGGVDLVQNVPDLRQSPLIPLATFSKAPQKGDTVLVTNLKNGEEGVGGVTEGGLFRVGIRADRGDPLSVVVLTPGGDERTRLEALDRDITFEGEDFAKDSQLIALGDGFGLERNTPDFRKLFTISQMVFEPGDPINYAPHIFLDPLYVKVGDKELSRVQHEGQGTPIRVGLLHIPTIGDTAVPIATALGFARAAGVLDFTQARPEYSTLDNDSVPGTSENGVLLAMHVYEGVERFRRFAGVPFNDSREILGDPDNLSNDTECYSDYCLDQSCQGAVTDEEVNAICEAEPSLFRRAPKLTDLGLPPLRINRDVTDEEGSLLFFSGMRLPYLNPRGEHGFAFSRPTQAFDVANYLIHLIGLYFSTNAQLIEEDLCLEDASCPGIAQTVLP